MQQKNLQLKKNNQFSYEIYKELSSEICAPIDDANMTNELRLELYKSKLVYLNNLFEDCFRNINSVSQNEVTKYSQEDFVIIKKAIDATKVYLNETKKELLKNELDGRGRRKTNANNY